MKFIQNIFFALIRYSGIFKLYNKFILRRKVTIVLYHDPKPDVFNKHIKFLSKNFNFIPLDLLVNAIYKKDWTIIPNNSIVITFDDGHVGNFLLYDTIKKYNIFPTFYVCANIINTNRHFWWKELNHDLVESLKHNTNKYRLNYLYNKFNFKNTKEYPKRDALNMDELKKLSKTSIIGSHTCFHPILTCCDSNESNDEISLSKKIIEKITSKECLHFCYPNGDYNDEIIKQVKRAGYISARTIDVGWNDKNTNPFKLKITGISDDASINKLISQLTGITMYLRYLSKGSLNGKYKTIKPKMNEY